MFTKIISKIQNHFILYRKRVIAMIIAIPFLIVALNVSVNALNTVMAENLVDERFELVSLVFRLAGDPNFSETLLGYQRTLEETFGSFSDHPVVEYARWLNAFITHDAVFYMAVHLERTDYGFRLSDNIASLVEDGGWTPLAAVRFVELLNDFYADTNFSSFFRSNKGNYRRRSAEILEQSTDLDREWFRQFGIEPDNLRLVVMPVWRAHGHRATVLGEIAGDTVSYVAISHYFYRFTMHGFMQTLARPLGHYLYHNNEDFHRWSNDTVDPNRLPFHLTGQAVGYGYLTRALTWLYVAETQNRSSPVLEHGIAGEARYGWIYITEVFNLVAEMDRAHIAALMNAEVSRVSALDAADTAPGYISFDVKNAMADVLGATDRDFKLGEEFRFTNTFGENSWSLRWYPIQMAAAFLTNGLDYATIMPFPTQIGDAVLLIDYNGIFGIAGYRYLLLVDVGSAAYFGYPPGHGRELRVFHIMPLRYGQ